MSIKSDGTSLAAIGIIDALGFKGIWERHTPQSVVATLTEARRVAQSMITDALVPDAVEQVLHAAGELPALDSFAFSDSILVTASVTKADRLDAALAGLAGVASAALSYALRYGAKSDPPLVFRGVVAVGRCYVNVEDKIFIGPAIDEAAAQMNEADGAFVYLSARATELSYRQWDVGSWENLLVDYEVPLKRDRMLRTRVINPFAHISHVDPEFAGIRKGYLDAMASDAPDVVTKRKNTTALLDHFEALSRVAWERAQRRWR